VTRARPRSSARQLLSIASAADLTGVVVKTVRRRISDGSLTGYRIGPRLIRVDADELDALLRKIPAAGSAG